MRNKILALNGSPRSNGYTYKCLKKYSNYLCDILNQDGYKIIHIDVNLRPCINCVNCKQGCVSTNDNFSDILEHINQNDHIILGTPVYLDTPTPQVMALLHRLNCMAESTGRKFFRDKKIYLLSTAYCSGTKSAISIMMRSCEMLGFTIPGRSTREYIQKWSDKKIRGGMSIGADSFYLD
jgi:multimeric flavodoxin WrbA